MQNAENAWVQKIVDSRVRTKAFRMECTPRYDVSAMV